MQARGTWRHCLSGSFEGIVRVWYVFDRRTRATCGHVAVIVLTYREVKGWGGAWELPHTVNARVMQAHGACLLRNTSLGVGLGLSRHKFLRQPHQTPKP